MYIKRTTVSSQLVLNIYGYLVLIQSDLFTCENLKAAKDFQHFREIKSYSEYHLRVSLRPLKSLKTSGFYIGKTKMCRVRQKSFNRRELEYIHNNQTMAIVDDLTAAKTRQLDIKALNIDVIDDILYFFLNSSAGEHLEYNGMMRLHALSFTVSDKAILVHGSPGYGKSTLALELIKNPQVKIFSDEITILNLNTYFLYPYPMRIASVENLSLQSGSQSIKFTYFFNKKSLVTVEPSKVATPTRLNYLYKILNLNKNYPLKSEIRVLQKIKLSLEIFLGAGLIQMWEYLLRLNNLHVIVRILINRIKLICYLWNIKSFTLNKNCNLNDKVNSLL